MNTPESLNGLVSDLIRRGLPADYATRAATEMSDHHCDLVEELQGGGLSESQATTEASHRLGNSHSLVKKIVREYQRRFWCGRWPLLWFLFGPLPVAIAVWFATGLAVWLTVSVLTWFGLTAIDDPDVAFRALPVGVKYAVLVGIFLIVPAGVLYFFARLSKRAALSSKWVILAACVLGLSAGACKWERIGPGSRIVMHDRTTLQPLEQPKEPDFVLMLWAPINQQAFSWREVHGFFLASPIQSCQLLLPIAVAVVILRRRQLALRTDWLAASGC
jgi:hypothetical protein